MLIEFKFSNYRSFRDEAVLSMEATGLGTFRKSLIEYRPAGKSTNHPIRCRDLWKERRRQEQCDSGILVGGSIYSECPADAA